MKNTLRAFHNDPAIKAKFIARVKAHEKADVIIKGQYWSNGEGCAVGCTLMLGNEDQSIHKEYENQLGLPEWLARLEDRLFEGMPNKDAKNFPRKFLEAIPVGADLTLVKPKLLYWILQHLPKVDKKYPDVIKAIKDIMVLLKRQIRGEEVKLEEWKAARTAAAYAAADAYAAAYAAAADTDAYAAATAAYAAAADTDAYAAATAYAAYAAAYAAYAAYARQNTFLVISKQLLKLLRAAK